MHNFKHSYLYIQLLNWKLAEDEHQGQEWELWNQTA